MTIFTPGKLYKLKCDPSKRRKYIMGYHPGPDHAWVVINRDKECIIMHVETIYNSLDKEHYHHFLFKKHKFILGETYYLSSKHRLIEV